MKSHKFHIHTPNIEHVLLLNEFRENPHPAGEGLRWVAFGFSALGLSDHEILQREFIVYDALYAECQRRVAALPS